MAKDQPINMFGNTGVDLPIFSGTPQRATVSEFKPQEAVRQPSMFAATCPICFGTGKVTRTIRGKTKVIKCMFCT